METPDPTLVGNNFIIRYYTVLSRNPDALHHFYSDRSSRTFGNEDEESAPIKGVEDIKKHIESHEFKQTQVLLSTVDCQGSANGGIFISVVGHISQDTTRKFTQTFFLEHLDDKYYVLNDIFRYLHTEEQVNGRANDEEEEEEDIEEPEETRNEKPTTSTPAPSTSAPVAASPAPTSQPAPTSSVQAPVSTPSATSPAPASTPSAPAPKQEQPLKSEQPQSKTEPQAPSRPNETNKPDQRAQHEKKESSKASNKSEGRKNWVDIFKPTDGAPQPHQADHQPQQKHAPQQKEQSQQSQQQHSQQSQQSHSSHQSQQQAQSQHSSGSQSHQSPQTYKEPKSKAWPVLDKECSIYARALAYNTTAEQLMTAFSPYGKVTNVVLKSSKGFAFIAFDSPQTVQNALDALRTKNIILPGQTTPLVIEQRKPSKHNAPVTLPHSHSHAPSPRGRGRMPHGRTSSSPRIPREDKGGFSAPSQSQQGQGQAQGQQAQQGQAQGQGQQPHYAPKRSYADRRASSEFSQSTPPQRHFSSNSRQQFSSSSSASSSSNNNNKPSV